MMGVAKALRYVWACALLMALWLPSTAALGASSTIIIGTTDKIVQLEPAQDYDFPGWWLISQTHEALFSLDPRTEKPVPALATSYEVSPDGLTYTFHLRKGVTFTDGTPFDANAVKFTFERNLKLNGDPVWLIQGIDKVNVIDPYTVQIVLKAPDASFLQKLAYTSPAAILSPKTYTAATVQATEKVTDTTGTVGTGPYMIAKYVPDQYVLLTAYPGYWGPKPKTQNILIKFYPDASALALALRSGEIDVAWRSLNPDDLTALAKDPHFQTIKGAGGLSIRYIVFQTKMAPFDNVDVRKALALAVDRDEIMTKVFAGYDKPAYSLVPSGLPGSIDTYPQRDLVQAKALLEQAGYSASKPLTINLWFDSSGHYSSKEADVAALLKHQIEATGVVDVTLQPLDWGAMTQKRDEASMGMFLLGWYPDYVDASDYLTPFLSSPDDKWTGSKYQDPVMQAIINAANVSSDDAVRVQLDQAAQELMARQVPYVPLWVNSLQNYAVAKPDIKGIYLPADMEIRLAQIYRQ